MTSNEEANQPDPGTDSTVKDWFGQSVDRDAEIADRVSEKSDDPAEAEAEFEAQSQGREEQASRHGDQIDPDQGRSAYQDDT